MSLRVVRLSTFSALALAGVLATGLALEACGSDSSDATSGKRVVLHTRVGLEPSVATGFTTATGWKVTLSKAVLATGPFYYFDGPPPLVRREEQRSFRLAQRFLGIAVAHAHPGHYQAGNAMGEMLEPYSVDLLAGTADFPDGDGITGIFRSARFSFSTPATGPAASAVSGHAAITEGKAEKDGETARFFRATAELADIEKSAAEGHVEGCEFHEVNVGADGLVTVLVNPSVWFNLVDFTLVEPGSETAPSEFTAGTQPQIAFAQGLAQLSAYKFTYSAQ